jgi:uncharacterized protein (UPF0276 family)
MKIGICYRPYLHKKLLDKFIDKISLIEIMPDIMSVPEMEFIKNICETRNIDMGLHCLRSSLFSPEGPNIELLENYFYVNKYVKSKYFSDHIAYSHINGKYLTSVHAIQYIDRNIQVFENNMEVLNKYFPEDFSIENITQNVLEKGSSYSESEFIKEITEKTGVSLLFDLTNMYITACNNGIEFDEYIQHYPFDKVRIVHVSGLTKDIKGIYHDVHSENFDDEILGLLMRVKDKMTNLEYVLIERDFNINNEEDILNDINSLQNVFEQ